MKKKKFNSINLEVNDFRENPPLDVQNASRKPKHEVWLWSRDSYPFAVCGKRRSKSFY